MKLNKLFTSSLTSMALSASLFAGALGTHWGYTGHSSPEHWAELNPLFFMCKEGSNQSPINITKDVILETKKGLDKIYFNYNTSANSVINNGHTIQVNVTEGSFINIDGIKFDLKQFHFHSPSENQIDGKNFPLEAHFVHVSKDGKIAVIAVMFEYGKENKYIKKIWNKNQMKKDVKNHCGDKDKMIRTFLPKDKAYYRFDGSLTTPPCTEGVRWLVMENYLTVSEDQIKEFTSIMHGHDNRPVQPINARKVLK